MNKKSEGLNCIDTKTARIPHNSVRVIQKILLKFYL